MRFWIAVVLGVVGIGCILTAAIWQQVLCYQTFGVIFDKVFIPHWSALFYLGVIPLLAAWGLSIKL